MLKLKLTLSIIIVSFLSVQYTNAFVYTPKMYADYLSVIGIINIQKNAEDYKLDDLITRREMAKVTLNLSYEELIDRCSWIYADVFQNDWGCKYIETGKQNNYFSSNPNFNPANNVSKIEALKMIMKALSIEKSVSSDWREWYVSWAIKNWFLEESFSDYDTPATRGWIFYLAGKAHLNQLEEENWQKCYMVGLDTVLYKKFLEDGISQKEAKKQSIHCHEEDANVSE